MLQLRTPLRVIACQLMLQACMGSPVWGENDHGKGIDPPDRLRLSFIESIEGDVNEFHITPDGSRVVYLADPLTDNVSGLFSVPSSGGSVLTLVAEPSAVSLNFILSAEGSRAIFAGEVESELRELYSVPVLGGPIVRLNPPLVSGRVVQEFKAAGDRVIYRADQVLNNVEELFSVPVDGGTAVKLNGTLASGDVLDSFQVSADGSRVIYLAAQDSSGVNELYSAPFDGNATAVKLNGSLESGNVTGFEISGDSTRVVYRAAQDQSGVFELYSAPIDGSAPAIKISGMLVDNGDVSGSFQIDPSSNRVVYQADQTTDGAQDLYSVPILGGTAVQLTDGFVAGGALSAGNWLASSQTVAFIADRDTDEVLELFTAPIGGGTVVKVSGTMVAGGNVTIFKDLKFTGDGTRVIYGADQEADGQVEVFSSLVAGGGNVKLNAALSNLVDFGIFEGSEVWYRAFDEMTFDTELYRVPADASMPAVKVNGSIPAGADVQEPPKFSADRIFYRADQDSLGVAELYSTGLSGGGITKLNGPITARGGLIREVLLTPDGRRVLYRGQIEFENRDELYSADLTTGEIIKLNQPLIADGDVQDVALSIDGSRVVYRAPQDTRAVNEAYSVSTAGGPGIKLNSALVLNGDVNELWLGESNRVIYLADQDTDNVPELYSVDIEGGAVTKLSDPLPLGRVNANACQSDKIRVCN